MPAFAASLMYSRFQDLIKVVVDVEKLGALDVQWSSLSPVLRWPLWTGLCWSRTILDHKHSTTAYEEIVLHRSLDLQ